MRFQITLLAMMFLISACHDLPCPYGYKKLGTRCELLMHSLDGGVTDAAAHQQADARTPRDAGPAAAELDARSVYDASRDQPSCKSGIGADATCACANEPDAGCNPIDECAVPNLCSKAAYAAVYPCVNLVGSGYSCQGQFADWPMPDAVPGAKVAPSYDKSSTPGVVVDKVTRLHWQFDYGCSNCTFQQATSYCESLDLAGSTDWRLPTKIELESLTNHTGVYPAIDPLFWNTPAAPFATSSIMYGPGAQDIWGVDFSDGTTHPYPELAQPTFFARCVRSSAL